MLTYELVVGHLLAGVGEDAQLGVEGLERKTAQ
jgi:hypothetical protein